MNIVQMMMKSSEHSIGAKKRCVVTIFELIDVADVLSHNEKVRCVVQRPRYVIPLRSSHH